MVQVKRVTVLSYDQGRTGIEIFADANGTFVTYTEHSRVVNLLENEIKLLKAARGAHSN